MKIILLILLSVSLWGNIGAVMALKGTAEIIRFGSSIEIKSGIDVKQKDEIITQDNSRVQVMLNDDTVVTIGSNSSFSFEEFSQEKDGEKIEMRANRGFFRSVSGKIGKFAPERFKVKTASAIIGIRGTDFSGDIAIKKEVFKCYEGAILVKLEDVVKEIESGMMIEISGQDFEIKDFKATQAEDISSKDIIQESEVTTEEISDITETIEENIHHEGEHFIEQMQSEPFELTPNTEDRLQKY